MAGSKTSWLDEAPDASWLDDAEDAREEMEDPDQHPEAVATRLAEKAYEYRKPGMLESIGRGSLKGALRDWGDEAIARTTQGLNALTGGETDYDILRKKSEIDFNRAQAENPVAFGGSEMAALFGTAPLTLNPITSGVVGAVEGGVQSLGKAKQIDAKALQDAAIDAAISGASSAAFTRFGPAAFQAISKPLKGVHDKLRDVAGRQAVQAMKPTQKMVKDLVNKGIYEDVGKRALDAKVVGPIARNSTMAERARQFTQDAADKTKPIYAQAKNASMTKDDLIALVRARQQALGPEPGKAPMAKKLGGYADDIEAAGEAGRTSYSPSDLRNFRRDIDDTINFNSDSPTYLGGKEMRSLLRDQEMGLIEKVDPKLRAENEKLFRDIRLGNEMEKIAERGEAQNASNNAFGLTSFITGGAIGSAGSALGLEPQTAAVLGGIGLLGREGVRRYGNQMAATGLNQMAKMIASPKYDGYFRAALKRGPTAIAAVHQKFMNEDPEYAAAYDNAQQMSTQRSQRAEDLP